MDMHCPKARKDISLAMDGRLAPPALRALAAHLHACPACRSWRQEQSRLAELLGAAADIHAAPDFYASLRERLDLAPARRRSWAAALSFRPALLRAALALLLVVSAALGFFLGGRLAAPSPRTTAAAFNQAMNLDLFADLPAGSFGAVYDRLLQGDRQ